jgi:hypothetical protein
MSEKNNVICESDVYQVTLRFEKETCFTLKLPRGLSRSEMIKLIEDNLIVLDEDEYADYSEYDFDTPSDINFRVTKIPTSDIELEIKLNDGQYKLFFDDELV